ncbi:MAG: HlyD family secretion protein, partial [Methylocystis sp.]
VPVRIALNKDEIEKEPLRPGLSTVTSIYVGSSKTSPNASIVKTTSNEYQTEVYDKDLTEAQIQGNKIIKQNLVETSSDEDLKCTAED